MQPPSFGAFCRDYFLLLSLSGQIFFYFEMYCETPVTPNPFSSLISGKKNIYTNSSFFFNICFSLLEQEMPAANLHGHIFAAPLCSPHLRKPTRRQGRFTRLNKQKPSRDARHGADFFLYLSSLGLCTAPRSKPQRGDPSPAPRSLGARLAAN